METFYGSLTLCLNGVWLCINFFMVPFDFEMHVTYYLGLFRSPDVKKEKGKFSCKFHSFSQGRLMYGTETFIWSIGGKEPTPVLHEFNRRFHGNQGIGVFKKPNWNALYPLIKIETPRLRLAQFVSQNDKILLISWACLHKIVFFEQIQKLQTLTKNLSALITALVKLSVHHLTESIDPNSKWKKLCILFVYQLLFCIAQEHWIRILFYSPLIKPLLSLRFGNLFNKDPWYWIPSCVPISVSISVAISDPESNAHLSFVNVVAVPLNMADTMEILTSACLHVSYSVNGQRSRTLSAIESEVPTFAAAITAVNPQRTRPVNM